MRNYSITDPFFNEFVFNAIVNSSADQRARLPFDFYAVANFPGKAKIFADTATLERKMTMLSHLGISCSVWFSPPDHMNTEILQESMKEFKQMDRLTSQKKMIQNRQFVFCDRDMMASLNVMGQTCHHETFIMNRDYYQVTEQLTTLNDVKPSSIEAAKPAMSEYKLLTKFILQLILHRDMVDGLTSFKDLQLSILLYLFVHRNTYVDQKTISEYLYPAYKKSSVFDSLTRLRQRALIDRLPHSDRRIRRFAITGSGIQIVGNYMLRIVNQTFVD
jgi:DNA-binding MarR family transcriptional regulator